MLLAYGRLRVISRVDSESLGQVVFEMPTGDPSLEARGAARHTNLTG